MPLKTNLSTDRSLLMGKRSSSHASLAALLLVVGLSLCPIDTILNAAPPPQRPGFWVTAYYAGWMQGTANNGHLPAEVIDYAALTHIIHFSLIPLVGGGIDWNSNSLTEINSSSLISRAHAAGNKVLVAIGGWGSDVAFRDATTHDNLSKFVTNVVNFVRTRGYDGVDLDWELLTTDDAPQFIALVAALRTELNSARKKYLLTMAAGWEPGIIARVHRYLDQVNVMTYDMSGAWNGWVTWHNAPVYDGGARFPSNGKPLPSADTYIKSFASAGVPNERLGIGIDFYGYVWTGGNGTSTGGSTEPRQNWVLPPAVKSNVPYFAIMRDFYSAENYRWDSVACGAYLRIDRKGSAGDTFVSYDNEASIRSKFEYAIQHGLGGVMIWELGGGYRPELQAGRRQPLLQAVKTTLFRNALLTED
jgi:chitinase